MRTVEVMINSVMKNRVREMREKAFMTQKELGEKVGVSRQAINAIETGKFAPSIWLAYDLAKFFGMSIEDLFDFEGSKRN
jgi:putative transcriptional regulator